MLDAGDGDESDDEESAVQEEAEASIEADDGDEGQTAHNERVSKTLRGKAILIMEEKGIVIDPREQRSALQIFPRVSQYNQGRL